MQQIRTLDREHAALVGWGFRVMLVTREGSGRAGSGRAGSDGAVARRLAGLGGQVVCLDDICAALLRLRDAPPALFVVECDGFGGIAAVRRRCGTLRDAGGATVPAILIGAECRTQLFPADRDAPVVLRAPLSAVSLRVGFEHALRGRLACRL